MRPGHGALHWGVVAIFAAVYFGMILGGLPRLKLARAAELPRVALAPQAAAEPAPLVAWQTSKGLGAAGALLLLFLFTDWPREVAALVGAGVLLLSRRLHSSRVMGAG